MNRRWIVAAACAVLPGAFLSAAPDVYPDAVSMERALTRGTDYSVTALDRKSPVTVMAIHGGQIEPGTDKIAAAVAGKDWNLFVFEGLGARAADYHVTATRFNDPEAVALATEAVVGVSIHEERDAGERICIGGGNGLIAKKMGEALSGAGFAVEEPCRRLPGADPRNIVNRPSQRGVQLELSYEMAKALLENKDLGDAFIAAVRSAVPSYLSAGVR